MKLAKKVMLVFKIAFLSVFGTSRGLRNVEEEMAFIADETPSGKPTL